MNFEEGDLVFWDYKKVNSIFVTVVTWESVRRMKGSCKLFGGFEIGTDQQPVFFYSEEATMVCKNSINKNYEIKDVNETEIILRDDEVLITLQDLFIEGELIGHKVLLGDTKKWILA